MFSHLGLASDYCQKNEKLLELLSKPKVSILDLKYDLSPPDFISMVITEIGVFPSTAVSAVIRRKFTSGNNSVFRNNSLN